MQKLFPRRLPRRATIGIIAPASPQRDERRLERGIRYLESLGHTVVLGKNLYEVHGGYLAGTDEQRVADLHTMFADRRIDAIFCSRGGYGSGRLLDKVDYALLRRNPKIFVGFSDITALQLAMYRRAGLVTFSGALPSVDMADEFDSNAEEWFWRALQSTRPLGNVQQPEQLVRLRKGAAEGVLLGGNLSVLITLLATPYLPSLRGAVVVLEDIGEDTYRLDRMFNHLRLAGVFGACAGLVFGQWTQRETNRTTPPRDINEVLAEVAAVTSAPVLSNLMYGHQPDKLTLPMGVRVRVGGSGTGMRFLESAVTK